MKIKKNFFHSTGITLVAVVIPIMILGTSSQVYAQESTPVTENGTCITCHEDLYFLHDTGNWFCIREAPMQCVDCHGGNPNTITKDEAHMNRKAHPIVNEDISKCQECHPEECMERIGIFDQTAGISDVSVAAPYQPKLSIPVAVVPTEQVTHPAWLQFLEIILVVFIIALVITVYFAHKAQHNLK